MSDGHFHRKKKRRKLWLVRQKIFALAAAFHPWRWHLVNVLRGPGHGHRQNRPKICLGFLPKMARSPSSKEITRLAQFVSRKARASRNWPTSSLRAVHQRQRQLNPKWIEILFLKSGSHLHSLNLKFGRNGLNPWTSHSQVSLGRLLGHSADSHE